MKEIPFFITGQPRSGTSLICEIIGQYPKKKSISQSLPLLLYFLSNTFSQQQKQSNYYPITPLFLENESDQDAWFSFLANLHISKTKFKEIALKSQSYSGVYSPSFLGSHFSDFEGSFFDLIRKTSSFAIKEVFAEDFIPYFLKLKAPTLLIIRDPRDMIASLLSGKQMGDLRGFYFHLLMWRKSVAFALNYKSDPNFKFILLEDLLDDLPFHLTKLERFLGDDKFAKELLKGNLISSQWKSNSNCEEIPHQKIIKTSDRKDRLTADQILFIETICFVEMKTLNYNIPWDEDTLEFQLKRIKDPIDFKREGFPSHWVWNEASRNQELKRLHLLNRTKKNEATIKKYFLFSLTYKKLKNCFG